MLRGLRLATVLVTAAAFGLAGCTGSPAPGPTPSSTTTGTPASTGTPVTGAGGSATATDTSEPPGDVTDARVTYDFGVPADTVDVTNPVSPPLPRLVGIYTGDHPQDVPAYQRISFYFQGAFPSYRFGFVSAVVQDGSGKPVTLDGTSIVSLTFVDAQAHDDAGASTVTASPPGQLGMSHLVSYAQTGDFEGHVGIGLGLRGPDGTTKKPAIRLGQLRRGDTFVVYLDVRVN